MLRPPASQQPHWPTPTPPPPPPTVSRLSADAPVFTPGFQAEPTPPGPPPEKPALSCSALPFIPSETTRAMANQMASNMNASAEEFMPQVNQVEKSWTLEEETWKEPWRSPEQTQAQTWNERKWNAPPEPHRYSEHHRYEDAHYDDGHRYDDAPRYEEEYMKGDPKGKGWNNKGQAKGKMAKGQTWTNGNGNTTWKGSNNRGVANGQYNGQHNAQHGHHNSHRRSTEWNDWEEKWDDWEEKGEWSESWRSQWRGAEPKQPQQWNQDQKLCIATFIFMAGTSFEACVSNIRSVAIPIETATCSRRRIKGRVNMGKQEFKTIEGTYITYVFSCRSEW